MGCGPSRTEPDVNLQDFAPRPIQNENRQPEPELSRADLEQALAWVAEYISKNSREEITIVAVGGVINTITLRSRASTHDVDWFNVHLSGKQTTLLHQAATYSIQQASRCGMSIASDWFNNKTMLFIPPNLREALVAESFQQNYTVFNARGLRVVAAPWGYSLVAKLDRMAGGGGKLYDPADAANYLYEYLRYIKRASITSQQVQVLAQKYRANVTRRDMSSVNDRFRDRFGTSGIILG